MIKTLSTNEIANELASDENANFTYSGGLALAEFLEEMEDESNPTEFCRVAIRCDFTQYDTLKEWAEDWFVDFMADFNLDSDSEEDEIEEEIRNYINDNGILLEFDDGIIVSSF